MPTNTATQKPHIRLIDRQLTPKQTTAFAKFLQSRTLAQGQAYLLEKHGLSISNGALSNWAAHRRKAAEDTPLKQFLRSIESGEAGLNEALLLLSQALAAAKGGEREVIEQIIKIFTSLSGAFAISQRATASLVTAQTYQQKVTLNLPQRTRDLSAELQQIQRTPGLSDHDKMLRALENLFGPSPTPEQLYAAACFDPAAPAPEPDPAPGLPA